MSLKRGHSPEGDAQRVLERHPGHPAQVHRSPAPHPSGPPAQGRPWGEPRRTRDKSARSGVGSYSTTIIQHQVPTV